MVYVRALRAGLFIILVLDFDENEGEPAHATYDHERSQNVEVDYLKRFESSLADKVAGYVVHDPDYHRKVKKKHHVDRSV